MMESMIKEINEKSSNYIDKQQKEPKGSFFDIFFQIKTTIKLYNGKYSK